MKNLKNRARVMLTAVGLLAVVGGALAFKARSTESLYCTTQSDPNYCTSRIFFRTTAVRPQKIGDLRCTTIPTTAPCPVTAVYVGI